MIILVICVLFGIVVSFFATQNTQEITIHALNYQWSHVPLYFIVLTSLLIGVIFSWLIYMLNAFSQSFITKKKQHRMDELKKENIDIAKHMHELEIENAQLKAKYDEDDVDDKSL